LHRPSSRRTSPSHFLGADEIVSRGDHARRYSIGYSLPNDEDYALAKLGPALDEAAAFGLLRDLPLELNATTAMLCHGFSFRKP
jgi:hypothetical protein